ncbi:MAG: hypothetical protein O2904_03735 [bacterium]|nr:hypothetical protein [bacterium]
MKGVKSLLKGIWGGLKSFFKKIGSFLPKWLLKLLWLPFLLLLLLFRRGGKDKEDDEDEKEKQRSDRNEESRNHAENESSKRWILWPLLFLLELFRKKKDSDDEQKEQKGQRESRSISSDEKSDAKERNSSVYVDTNNRSDSSGKYHAKQTNDRHTQKTSNHTEYENNASTLFVQTDAEENHEQSSSKKVSQKDSSTRTILSNIVSRIRPTTKEKSVLKDGIHERLNPENTSKFSHLYAALATIVLRKGYERRVYEAFQ